MNSKIININILDALYDMIEYMPDLGSEIFINVKKKTKQIKALIFFLFMSIKLIISGKKQNGSCDRNKIENSWRKY